MKSPFLYIVITVTFFYYGFGIWYFGQIQNYIPDPRYGLTWFILLTEPFEFIMPFVLVAVYSAILSGGAKYLYAGAAYLGIFGLILILKALYFAAIWISCSAFGKACNLIPTDFTQSDPTKTDVWLTISIYQFVELILLGLWVGILVYAQKWAGQDQERYLEILLKEAGLKADDAQLVAILLIKYAALKKKYKKLEGKVPKQKKSTNPNNFPKAAFNIGRQIAKPFDYFFEFADNFTSDMKEKDD